jgi:hypothetical protein
MIKNHALDSTHSFTSHSSPHSPSTATLEYSHDFEATSDEWYSKPSPSPSPSPSPLSGRDRERDITRFNPLRLGGQETYEDGIGGGGGLGIGGIGGRGLTEGLDEDYSNEPPLLEELGIRFDHIFHKTQAVMIPMKVGNYFPFFLLPFSLVSFLDD